MLEKYFGRKEINPVKNPFNMRHIERISMFMLKSMFTGEFSFEATVSFKNGSTSGSQEITGTDFSDLFQKVIDFCKTLE